MGCTGARAIVLGSGAGGGLPQWNCGCRHCALAREGDARVVPRSQASLALTGNGRHWLIVNAAPDLRSQIIACTSLSPERGTRASPITDVILTGGEIDQIAGLLTLREGHAFRISATSEVLIILSANPIFDALDPKNVERRVVRPPCRIELAGLAIECIALPGKAPLYLERDGAADPGEMLALLARPLAGGLGIACVPGCAAITPALQSLLARADIVLMDGTVFHDDELARAGMGTKTGRRMGHLPIAGEGGTLSTLTDLAPRRRIYTHVNNTNPVLLADSPERGVLDAAGIELAHDGMEIALEPVT
ncbi:pyrroloquinoline quinone biosynthesis protein PqqB [Enterovirga rhinocerotis]|uniref:Coenzyme PQQ synthesis protein B n=1 Tax=Enterovirga rhinocerotis TaxID=1339210 RepID=A0A4R7BJ94_9HYPH|nr:pyrroloquinoline quinone biosynthesis protein PqqB [Enterovirga rhinocerotis]TDR85328.1 pyrroloquinoline quinone biosynthesis protein B [Enterovirga rhinocerotis]